LIQFQTQNTTYLTISIY